MITYLSSPKPFTEKIASLQFNAIRSWLATTPEVEVILYGDSEGIEDASRQLGVKYVKDIAKSEYGTPLFGAIAEHAAQHAKYDLQAYINCDILLTKELLLVAKIIPFPQFLMIGQRLDLAKDCPFDLDAKDWRVRLVELAQMQKLTLHPPAGSDYFVFRRGLWKDLPPVTIGRGGYDNVLISFCLERRIPVCDATFYVPAVHQYHDYSHLVNGSNEVFQGKEARQNIKYYGKQGSVSLEDATWTLRKGRLKLNWACGDWLRALETYMRFTLGCNVCADAIHFLWRITHRLGISKTRIVGLSEIFSSLGITDNIIRK